MRDPGTARVRADNGNDAVDGRGDVRGCRAGGGAAGEVWAQGRVCAGVRVV